MPGHDMRKPYFSAQINVGNLIQMGFFLVMFTVLIVAMREQVGTARESIRDEVNRGVERDVKIRALEIRAERADERYNSIMSILHRIDVSVERISRPSTD